MSQSAAQGSKVVLLVSGDTYFEILAKDGPTVSVMGPTGGQAQIALADLEARGFTVRHAHKLVKTNGSWLYMAHGQHGTDLYQMGRLSPAAPLGMTVARTL